ncbi:ABC transporter permease [Gordonia sp. i37]|uniref:ABC transporter permease n=1 Tax=Gordonia sp. i37 TaxID=1961707 RepID=UPI0009AF1B0D|nr:ABC transporter permease [Gordonia sp. i37]OPX13531.1 ABC transporter permease [Gordonia sp. i37]
MTDRTATLIHLGPALVVGVLVLIAIAIAVNWTTSAVLARDTAVASIRAVVQLAALAAILAVVITRLPAALAFVGVMAVVASWTSASRVVTHRPSPRQVMTCLVPVAVPTMLVVACFVAVGVIPATGIAIIPTTGIMFGGAMNTTSLAGRRAHDELVSRHGEADAARALGFPERDARLEIIRTAASSALIPGLDQTRSVGLVTIPGAFVGMVLGGASTTTAAIMQLFVLISLLAVSSIAMAETVELIAREHL